MELHPQFVVDENQKPTAVLLPANEWAMLMEELEELEDIRAYDEAKAEPQERVPFDQAIRELGHRPAE